MLLQTLQIHFKQHANPEIATKQKAYLKSTMPFWGIPKPVVKDLCNKVFKTNPPQNRIEYAKAIKQIMFEATHREEWYAGIHFAEKYKKLSSLKEIPLFIDIVRLTQWWDIVDTVAANLIGPLLQDSDSRKKHLLAWINDQNMWVRRTAVLTQLKYKNKTDFDLLKQLILSVCHENEFFMRKAIGWILREYSKTNPIVVQNFITTHRDVLSNLSVREGSRIIQKNSHLLKKN